VAADMYEMLMIQNAQMHQMIMQQLMLSTITRPQPPAQVPSTSDDTLISVDIKDLIDVRTYLVFFCAFSFVLSITSAERSRLCFTCVFFRPSVCKIS